MIHLCNSFICPAGASMPEQPCGPEDFFRAALEAAKQGKPAAFLMVLHHNEATGMAIRTAAADLIERSL